MIGKRFLLLKNNIFVTGLASNGNGEHIMGDKSTILGTKYGMWLAAWYIGDIWELWHNNNCKFTVDDAISVLADNIVRRTDIWYIYVGYCQIFLVCGSRRRSAGWELLAEISVERVWDLGGHGHVVSPAVGHHQAGVDNEEEEGEEKEEDLRNSLGSDKGVIFREPWRRTRHSLPKCHACW